MPKRSQDQDRLEIASAIEHAVAHVAAATTLQAELDAAIEELRTGERPSLARALIVYGQ
jgi:hypothetical protein